MLDRLALSKLALKMNEHSSEAHKSRSAAAMASWTAGVSNTHGPAITSNLCLAALVWALLPTVIGPMAHVSRGIAATSVAASRRAVNLDRLECLGKTKAFRSLRADRTLTRWRYPRAPPSFAASAEFG